MNAPTTKPYRFGIITHISFKEEIPRASCGIGVYAHQICRPPRHRRHERYVIVEENWMFAHATTYKCHFFKTEETMLYAFRRGLHDFLSFPLPKKRVRSKETVEDFIRALRMEHRSHYTDHEGYTHGISFDDPAEYNLPWFLALKGQEISRGRVVLA